MALEPGAPALREQLRWFFRHLHADEDSVVLPIKPEEVLPKIQSAFQEPGWRYRANNFFPVGKIECYVNGEINRNGFVLRLYRIREGPVAHWVRSRLTGRVEETASGSLILYRIKPRLFGSLFSLLWIVMGLGAFALRIYAHFHRATAGTSSLVGFGLLAIFIGVGGFLASASESATQGEYLEHWLVEGDFLPSSP